MNNKRKWLLNWKKYGPVILSLEIYTITILYSFDIISDEITNPIMGTCLLLFLSLPCSINFINQYKIIWYIRQLVFLSIGIILIFI